jgi:8-oxo-dGTP pyrophosphatase MutT (NUDIX family)
MQMYKVFIQNTPLFFINSKKKHEIDGLFLSESLAITNKRVVYYLLQHIPKNMPLIITCDNCEDAINSFFSDYDFVEAAGGIVKRKDKYLFIKRNGFWDIPKGKIDLGESPEIAAVREIDEECGVKCDKVEDLICITYHTYQYKGRDTLKKTYWYSLNYEGKKNVKAQKEEGITKVKWFKTNKLLKVLSNTFPSIEDVLEIYFRDVNLRS